HLVRRERQQQRGAGPRDHAHRAALGRRVGAAPAEPGARPPPSRHQVPDLSPPDSCPICELNGYMPFNSHQGQKCGGGAQAGARWRAAPRDPLEERDEEIRAILMRRRDRLAGLREVLTDAALSSFAIVLAAERLPVLETIELHRELTRTGVDVGALVVNKRSPAGRGEFLERRRALEEEHLGTLRTALPRVPLQEVPLGEEDVVGPAALERFAQLLRP